MERLAAALNRAGTATVRRALLHGRPHLVAPARLIVPGVLAGSLGPLLYAAGEVAKTVTAWNHVPLLVNHPPRPGQSGRDPEVLEAQGVGVLLNARLGPAGELDGEAWFDEARLRAVDVRVLNALAAGRPLEVSTGLYLDRAEAPPGSAHNGVAYTHVASNYRPDHLAVLPDAVGACSRKDGCGLLVNGRTCPSCAPLTTNGGPPMPLTADQRQALVTDLATNCKCFAGLTEALNAKTDDELNALQVHAAEVAANRQVAEAVKGGLTYGDVSFTFNAGKFTPSRDFDAFKAALTPVVVQNAAKPANQAEWLALIPEDAKPTWNALQTLAKAKRDGLVARLTANARPEAKERLTASLGRKTIEELEDLADLLPAQNAAPADDGDRPLPDYTGAGAPARVVNKRSKVNDADILVPPEIDYAAAARDADAD